MVVIGFVAWEVNHTQMLLIIVMTVVIIDVEIVEVDNR